MPAHQLNITLIQSDIFWEDKEANLRQYEDYIGKIDAQREVVVLPEMFSTGFSMAPERLAEKMDGPSVQWMKDMAAKYRCILAGSLIIEDESHYFNRLIWMQPDGQYGFYDKRHLFGYGEEDKHYEPGSRKLITSVKGWKICPMVCYDLRFPVWARNHPDNGYDVLLYAANWPARRSLAWKTLLQARAIENQSYVVGVNRIGKDANDIEYTGDSSVFGPLGEKLFQQEGGVALQTITLEKSVLEQTRSNFHFLKDADNFLII
jgi:predicted amidohydrolase